VNIESEGKLTAFRRLIDSVGIPYHPVVGNHENGSAEGPPEKAAAYRKVFGERFHSTFTHRGLGFVIINNAGTAIPQLLPAAVVKRDRKLIAHLETHADRPAIAACHVPVVAMCEESVLAESFDLATDKVAEPTMAQILRPHRHHFAAVLSGHVQFLRAQSTNPASPTSISLAPQDDRTNVDERLVRSSFKLPLRT